MNEVEEKSTMFIIFSSKKFQFASPSLSARFVILMFLKTEPIFVLFPFIAFDYYLLKSH